MQDFVDLRGASGASYRFRRVMDGEAQPHIAGNFAVLRPRPGGFTVRLVGVTLDLADVKAGCPSKVLLGARLYVRLNVARAVREAEHQDLLANYGSKVDADGGLKDGRPGRVDEATAREGRS